jgi:tRNA-guanine family transglycosylase
MLAGTLLSIHNLHTLLKLADNMRQAIIQGYFESFSQDYLEKISRSDQELGS